MKVGYFTERPYRWVPEEEVFRHRSFFGVSNKYFDRDKAADDYNYWIREYCYAEEVGFDILALNEHHGNPFCMGSVMNVEAAVLAYATKKSRIMLIGNPLPVIKHPLRMAEELAEIDLISRGRLMTGWVRGAGSEQFFNNANPAYNREYFNEAHEFIIQAWTRPGPWRYEGEHFHYRHVNPWALPYQKPHPQIVVPGVLSPETVRWCAEHRYPYIGLGTALGPTCELWDVYADEAVKHGYQAGTENFGYLLPMAVGETQEKADQIKKGFIYGGGQGAFARPEMALPPGYNSKGAIRMLAKTTSGTWLGISGDKLREATGEKTTVGGRRMKTDVEDSEGPVDYNEVRSKLLAGLERVERNYETIAGTPKTLIPKIKTILQVLRPGIFVMFNVQGPVSNEDRMASMRLFANEIIPAIQEYAKELDLKDCFERTPGSVKLQSGTSRAPVSDRAPLKDLGLR